MKHSTRSKTVKTILVAAALVVAGSLNAGAGSKDEPSHHDGVIKHAMAHTQVRLALLENVGADALSIDIDVEGNAVELEGTVRNRSTVELARRIAQSVEGVETVNVDLDVDEEDAGALEEVSSELSDTLLATKVKLALLAELGMGAFKIEVESADGIVALSGEVEQEERRDVAAATAKDVSGVKKVRNLLKTVQS